MTTRYIFAEETIELSEIPLLFVWEAFNVEETNIEMEMPFNFRLP